MDWRFAFAPTEDVVTTRTALTNESGDPGTRVIRPLELVSRAIVAGGISRIPAITTNWSDRLWIGMTVLELGPARTCQPGDRSETAGDIGLFDAETVRRETITAGIVPAAVRERG
jgi:hypothetical protein